MRNAQVKDKLVELGKLFDSLYNEIKTEGGERAVIGVADCYVQLKCAAFVELFRGEEFKVTPIRSDSNPYELSANYDGVRFITLCSKEEFKNLF